MIGYADATGLGAAWKPRLTRAYNDGRRSYPSSSNPHTSGTPEYTAWQHGYDNRADSAYKRETCS
jgi:hypothetical protein